MTRGFLLILIMNFILNPLVSDLKLNELQVALSWLWSREDQATTFILQSTMLQ